MVEIVNRQNGPPAGEGERNIMNITSDMEHVGFLLSRPIKTCW
jgi:hypothetical protein